jgi:hypothetical protein
MDASRSMYALYTGGTVQRSFERALALAACFDDDGALDVWFFGNRPLRAPSVTESDLEGYVQRVYPKPSDRLGQRNNELAAMEDLVRKYAYEDPIAGLPVYVLFFSDGGVADGPKIAKLLREVSSLPIFWQFVGIGESEFGILRKLDTLTGRVVDNAGFFALDDLDTVSDEELYTRLLQEFPSWLAAARAAGVL